MVVDVSGQPPCLLRLPSLGDDQVHGAKWLSIKATFISIMKIFLFKRHIYGYCR